MAGLGWPYKKEKINMTNKNREYDIEKVKSVTGVMEVLMENEYSPSSMPEQSLEMFDKEKPLNDLHISDKYKLADLVGQIANILSGK
ncbi:hypothetical protein D3C79_515840 [compost metagenome]